MEDLGGGLDRLQASHRRENPLPYWFGVRTLLSVRSHRRCLIMKNSLATVPSSAYLASGSRLAACAAAWCALHCALTPFLVAVAPALALTEGVERAIWAGTVLLGVVMLVLGPACKNAAVILTFAGGSALWAASLAGWLEPLPEAATSAVGSLILAGALVQSARICQASACLECADEDLAGQRG